ncbi:hypothetical protein JZ751_009539, partial [Albula glossodonta]
MSKKPPNRPGITFEIGARVEAQDYLQKWYPSRIEKIDYDEGKMLVHFDRWSHRYDEWIFWDSNRLRPLERPALRKEGLKDEDEMADLKDGEEVLARWTDCRYYPAKIETVNKEGVAFFFNKDWIALVKAATAAAKNKGACRPRTSANSNKDKEARREESESDSEDDDDTDMEDAQEDLDSEKSVTMESDLKPSTEHLESVKMKRKKTKQGRFFNAKRARLSRNTGLGVSKVTNVDEVIQPDPPGTSEEGLEAGGEDSGTVENCAQTPSSQRHAPIATGSHCRAGSRRPKPEPGESHASPRQPRPSSSAACVGGATALPAPIPAPSPPSASQTALPVTSAPGTPRASEHSQRRRRSQRLATFTPEPPLQSANTSPLLPETRTSQSAQGVSEAQHIPTVEKSEESACPEFSEAVFPVSSLPPHQPAVTAKDEQTDIPLSNQTLPGLKSPPLAAVINTKRSDDPTSPNEPLFDLDHNKFKCQVPGCSKAFRKPKLLDYHLKYYHTLSPPSHIMPLECSGGCSKPPKFSKKKRSSLSVSSEGTEVPIPVVSRDRSFESLHDKILKKVIEKDPHMEPGLIKTEKKIKLEDKCQSIGYSDFEDISLAFLERCSSGSPFTLQSSTTSKHSSFQYPRAILSVDLTGENLSDIDFLEDSTTESLLLSGDEYGQDLDSLTMDDFQEEDDDANEIVRCICEMDEENGFMIQCEECMCWQHSVCMGLLEDSIPDQYICYICRDPPRQRWSAKYRHDKDWLNKGHMYGLSFLSENYSHQNAKKIVSTHQLLADVYSVKKVLHGLQLKMEILQNKHNPDLHLWARSWVNSDEDQPMGGVPDCIHFQEHLSDPLNQNSTLDAYIASEHSYQKPPGLGLGPWPTVDPLSSDGEEGIRLEEGPEVVAETSPLSPPLKEGEESTAITVSGCLNETHPDSAEKARNCLQWQLNLLTHIEDIQNQVASRMDLIEKELDVLESWLDFTGELEPPEPLARLPQLKRRIKQLLTDLGKTEFAVMDLQQRRKHQLPAESREEEREEVKLTYTARWKSRNPQKLEFYRK